MEVSIALKDWKIVKEEKTNSTKICGRYELMLGGKSIAKQEFNDGYQSLEIPFSGDLVQRVKAVEEDIVSEIKKMIS